MSRVPLSGRSEKDRKIVHGKTKDSGKTLSEDFVKNLLRTQSFLLLGFLFRAERSILPVSAVLAQLRPSRRVFCLRCDQRQMAQHLESRNDEVTGLEASEGATCQSSELRLRTVSESFASERLLLGATAKKRSWQ